MDLEHLEALAFAEDREAALARLLPGSADHDYYRCVHLQQRGKLEEAARIIDEWTNRHADRRIEVLKLRQMLLRLSQRGERQDRDDARDELGAHHWHEPEAAAGATRLPSALDRHAIDGASLLREAVRYSSDLSQVTEEGLYELLDGAYELDEARRRKLIERLGHTPSPKLVELISADLGPRELARFGPLAAHRALTLAQLGELAQERRELGQHREWVGMVVQRMRPPAHVSIERHGVDRLRYLESLWTFAQQLADAFLSLKLHVLWHLLDEARRQRPAQRDREKFLAYLRLPRHAGYLQESQWRNRTSDQLGQLGGDFRALTGLPTVSEDERLVRDYLYALLAGDGDDGDVFAPLFERTWFEAERARIRLLSGAPEAERWTRTLGPAAAQALLDQVEIELGYDNPEELGEQDELRLEIDVKNVAQLFVKVFRIDPVTYFAIHGREVGPDIDLDGLAASHEETIAITDPLTGGAGAQVSPIRRIRKSLALPQCARPGCYVIDLIGNGKSSRALVWKGRLRYVRRLSAAGQLLTVFDQLGQHRKTARLWLGGRELIADEDGVITVPFSTQGSSGGGSGEPSILLVDGELATVTSLPQVQEQVSLRVQAHVEREALSASRAARAVVKVELMVAGVLAPISLLQQATWELVLLDRFGATTQKTSPLALDDRSCAALEWPMPDDVAAVTIHVRGVVELMSEQRQLDVEGSLHADLAQMHEGPHIDALYLAATDAGYVLSALGKSGEAKAGQRIPMWFVHRWARTQQTVSLDTDERGRLELGPLAGVESLLAMAEGTQHGWQLAARGPGAAVQVLVGETVLIPPPLGVTAEEMLARASLVELRGGAPAQHANAALHVEGRNLAIRGLAAGEFQLRAPMLEPWSLTVLPAEVTKIGEHAATPTESYRLLPAPALIDRIEVSDEADGQMIVIAVRGASSTTRVHVVATRFLPAPAMGTLEAGRRRGGRMHDARPGAHYQSGRDLGDEYRYVLDRKQAARRPGVMVEKPSLLLNPWARQTTTTVVARPQAGGAYGSAPAPRSQAMAAKEAYSLGGGTTASFATFDFVPGDAVLLPNLRPDRDGLIRVAREKLGDSSSVQVICVDEEGTSSARVSLPERPLAPRDQRLLRALPADAHITQRRQIDPLRAGETVGIHDAATAKIHIVDTVERAHAYLLALGADDTLREFEFVTRWHKLSEAERSEKVSKYACHELNLFLYFRDRPYFHRVIVPYLAQKRVQTFVDRWLLGAELSSYLEPRELGRMCAVERALLALRLPQRDELARLLADEVALLPPDPEREGRIVEVMLAGAALDDDSSGLQEHAKMARDEADAFDDSEGADSTSELLVASFGDTAARSRGGGGPARPEARSIALKAPLASLASPAPMAPMAPMTAMAPPPAGAMRAAPKRARQVAEESEDERESSYSADKKREKSGADLKRRAQVAQMFRPADKTQEWAEHNWWHRRPAESLADMIGVNRFWRDLAAHRDGPFLSSGLGLAIGSFAEAMCALAVLDLPFEAAAHRIDNDGATLTITAAGNALVASSQLVAAELSGELPLIVGQSYLRNDDRHHLVEGEWVQKFATGPLVAGIIYATQVVVANPTGTQQRVSVLVQIPRGSVPTNAAKATRTYDVVLPPYAAHGIEVCFYFPKPGSYSHFGAHVSKRGALIAAAPGATLQVVVASDAVDAASWGHLSQHGSLEQVLQLLRTENLRALDLTRIAWRMRDEASYRGILEVLEQRLAYDPTLWSYALWHGDRVRMRRWLRAHDRLAEAGPVIDAALVELDAEQLEIYEHLELAPLINARAHRLGAKTKILNDGFAVQLTRFLELVAHRKAPTIDDLLVSAHYLFAQDRFDEARAAMERAEAADAAGHRSRMQLDYLRAYAACAAGELATARALARRWLDQPVDRWRKRFEAMIALLDQAESATATGPAGATVTDERSREQVQSSRAQAQPSFELAVDRDGVELASQQLAEIELRYFAMDIELLFSRQPFVQADVSRFSYIEPGHRQVIVIEGPTQRVPWPEAMRGKNVVVEAVGAGLRKAKVHYAHDLTVVTAHQYGQVRVARASTRAPVAAAYVKVYARRHDGEVAFFKDGYTDVRGWFDYASLSTDELDHTARFSILVHADALGATIVESAPPPR
jgi:hypothetical protein